MDAAPRKLSDYRRSGLFSATSSSRFPGHEELLAAFVTFPGRIARRDESARLYMEVTMGVI